MSSSAMSGRATSRGTALASAATPARTIASVISAPACPGLNARVIGVSQVYNCQAVRTIRKPEEATLRTLRNGGPKERTNISGIDFETCQRRREKWKRYQPPAGQSSLAKAQCSQRLLQHC